MWCTTVSTLQPLILGPFGAVEIRLQDLKGALATLTLKFDSAIVDAVQIEEEQLPRDPSIVGPIQNIK